MNFKKSMLPRQKISPSTWQAVHAARCNLSHPYGLDTPYVTDTTCVADTMSILVAGNVFIQVPGPIPYTRGASTIIHVAGITSTEVVGALQLEADNAPRPRGSHNRRTRGQQSPPRVSRCLYTSDVHHHNTCKPSTSTALI